MLLKFTNPDMLNTSLVDIATGERAFDIVTVLLPPSEISEEPKTSSLIPSSTPVASSSKSVSNASSSPKQPRPDPQCDLNAELRHTVITNTAGDVVANVTWNGRRPKIILGDEKVGALTDLFGSSTVRFMPKILAIPTRFDTEYVWTATADSLTLFDYDSDTAKGCFHHSVIRIPASTKGSKLKLASPSKLNFSFPSRCKLSSSSSTQFTPTSSTPSICSTSESELDKNTPKSTFISTRLPGVGSNYLEFTSHPLADDIEIILSFLMMEILRRGRFSLTPYTFDKPKFWQFKEARDSFLRRLRRNTV